MRKLFNLLLFVSVVAIAYFGYHYIDRHFLNADESAKGMSMPPTIVETDTVKKVTWQDTIDEIGILKAEKAIKLTTEISGRIASINVEAEDKVNEGDILFKLDDIILIASEKEAKANLDEKMRTLKRMQSLKQSNAIALSDLEGARADFEKAQAAFKKVAAQKQQAEVIAPFAGVIGLIEVDLGDYVSSGTELSTLQNINNLYVRFDLATSDASKVRNGQKLRITAEKQKFIGNIDAIDTKIDANSQTLKVQGKLKNSNDEILRPGRYVDVAILTEEKNLLTIPQTALDFGADDSVFVYKVTDGKAHRVKVEKGQFLDNDIAILSGLKEGDVIIKAGWNKIKGKDGAAVMTAKELQQQKGSE